ncbi:MAG: hypothetical protein ACJ8LG_21905 [Massilia sp.]
MLKSLVRNRKCPSKTRRHPAVVDVKERLARVEARLDVIAPQIATKADLAQMATKADIAQMATKSDLAQMATKSDLAQMATKSDLAQMATKSELTQMATKADLAQMATKADLVALEATMLKWFIGTAIALTGLVIAATQLIK